MKENFLIENKPTVTMMIQARTPERVLELIKKGNDGGADRFGLQLEKLEQTYGMDNTAENDDDRTGSNGLLKGIDSGSTQNDYRKFMYELGALKTAPCAAIGDAVSRNERTIPH